MRHYCCEKTAFLKLFRLHLNLDFTFQKYFGLCFVEFVLAPQHETSFDPETTAKEDFDYWRKIIEESNLEVCR